MHRFIKVTQINEVFGSKWDRIENKKDFILDEPLRAMDALEFVQGCLKSLPPKKSLKTSTIDVEADFYDSNFLHMKHDKPCDTGIRAIFTMDYVKHGISGKYLLFKRGLQAQEIDAERFQFYLKSMIAETLGKGD